MSYLISLDNSTESLRNALDVAAIERAMKLAALVQVERSDLGIEIHVRLGITRTAENPNFQNTIYFTWLDTEFIEGGCVLVSADDNDASNAKNLRARLSQRREPPANPYDFLVNRGSGPN